MLDCCRPTLHGAGLRPIDPPQTEYSLAGGEPGGLSEVSGVGATLRAVHLAGPGPHAPSDRPGNALNGLLSTHSRHGPRGPPVDVGEHPGAGVAPAPPDASPGRAGQTAPQEEAPGGQGAGCWWTAPGRLRGCFALYILRKAPFRRGMVGVVPADIKGTRRGRALASWQALR